MKDKWFCQITPVLSKVKFCGRLFVLVVGVLTTSFVSNRGCDHTQIAFILKFLVGSHKTHISGQLVHFVASISCTCFDRMIEKHILTTPNVDLQTELAVSFEQEPFVLWVACPLPSINHWRWIATAPTRGLDELISTESSESRSSEACLTGLVR